MSPPVIWIIAGVVLCLMEALLPTAFTELTLGISAIVVGLIAFALPNVGLQVALWLILSVAFLILFRRFMHGQTPRVLEDSKEAQTLTEILPGQLGRVLYEGNSWQALSESDQAIAPNQPVVVIGRRGTTLIIMSLRQLES